MRNVKPVPHRVIHLHPLSPPKPALGAPCNGCGLCCAAEPCPLGMLVSRRRRGRCAALLWSQTRQRHLCGLLADPHHHWPAARWLPAALLQRLVRRWIAAQRGCDSDLEPA